MTDERPLDGKDFQIIDLLAEDAWLTHTKISEAVHLSASAVQRRIDRLKSKGVITGARATVDRSKLQRRLRIYLLLELRDDGHSKLQALVDGLNSHSEVSDVDLLAGKFDILVTLDCQDTESFSEFAMRTINKNPNVRHCWTMTRLKKLM